MRHTERETDTQRDRERQREPNTTPTFSVWQETTELHEDKWMVGSNTVHACTTLTFWRHLILWLARHAHHIEDMCDGVGCLSAIAHHEEEGHLICRVSDMQQDDDWRENGA
jgi:hypothetical protein